MSRPLSSYKLLCFDVYGTLIDWESGIIAAAAPLLAAAPGAAPTRGEFLALFNTLERAQQARTPGLRYADLLARVHTQLASHYGVTAAAADADAEAAAAAFGASVALWTPFADTVAALAELHDTFRLVVLSNVDNTSFGATQQVLGGERTFDLVVTAEDVGAYKPDTKGFEHMLDTVQQRFGIARADVLVVAQSRSHDHEPAHRLGLNSVWINRAAAIMGLDGGPFDWEFATLGAMSKAVREEKEQLAAKPSTS